MQDKILIVDDEKNILDVLAYALKREGYLIDTAYNGKEALHKVDSFNPNILILDLMLPEINGYDICKKLEEKNIGIIMLTAKSDIVDKLLGLELGADDYLTKPFDIREVIARVKSLSRRLNKNTSEKENIINIKNLTINLNERTVIIDNCLLELTSIEFDLLYLLLSNPNMVYSRDQLLDLVWKTEYFGGTRTVDTHIQRIRKKLGTDYQNLIQTVHGTGYRGVNKFNENRN
ncbi:response regulator transcription factor [Clostridium pasteurianum]|uniref:Stage 0 sporulation protein A homolog n=1 Tax=Clostridium pasteurianum BC1 TaxID=86416 RepID=R4K9T0_CLOPA|nr:response regulator transcription factor [Clostridium pasteurianum]AGK98441.1 response regulator with CheY-like receiver domain and winged-helix DNA-binding domain [Clostridium pasteurianum BC1]